MKSIMLSIRPEWLQKILSGQKTVELRLSRPNLTPPLHGISLLLLQGYKEAR